MTRSAISIAELRDKARGRLPQIIFDYFEGGSGDERTLAANRAAFENVSFLPQCMVDVSSISQTVTLLGREQPSPLVLAPIGLCGLAWRDGEVEAARAAAAARIPFALSTMSIEPVETVREGSGADVWFQLYVMRDRELTKALIDRARRAGCTTLVLTVDVPVQGPRERDVRNGLMFPPRITMRNALDMTRRLPWIRNVLMGGNIRFGNLQNRGESIVAGAGHVAQTFDPSVSWKDFDWFRSQWDGAIVIKGILNPADALRAADQGAQGIVVSNHGGRQLDGAPSSFAALEHVVDAVGDRLDIIVDGGIRRGGDVVKCLAMGAKACMIGRPFVYGLAANGRDGVARAIAILQNEIATTLALLGVPDIRMVDRSALLPHAPAMLSRGTQGWV